MVESCGHSENHPRGSSRRSWPLSCVAAVALVIGTCIWVATPAGAAYSPPTIPVGREPSALAVNPVTNTIYSANLGDTHGGSASVINGATNTVTATISPLYAVGYGAAVNPVTNRAYFTTQNGTLTVVDGATNTVTATVSASPAYSFGVAVDPVTNRVYVGTSEGLAIIDGATNSVIATVTGFTGGTVAVNPVTDTVYVTGSVSGGNPSIYVVSGATNTVRATIPLDRVPRSLTVDAASNTLYLSYAIPYPWDSTLTVFSGTTNLPIATIAVGPHPVGGVTVDPTRNLVYAAATASNVDGMGGRITVINGATQAIVRAMYSVSAPGAVAVNPTTNLLYVTPGTDAVTVLSGVNPLNQPVVGMAATPSGKGYWQVAADGGVFASGDATFYGSMGGTPLNQPVAGMAATPTGKGYWLVAADGGIFAFGDAIFYGSMGGTPLNRPVTGMATTPTGKGYWLVGSDGGIFAFGDATFYGSGATTPPLSPVVGITSVSDGSGYWMTASVGAVLPFGDAGFYGSPAGSP